MGLKRKNKLAILRYRVVFEELEQAKQELKDGTTSLVSHLSFFRDDLSAKNKSQLSSFDNAFFGGVPDNQKNSENGAIESIQAQEEKKIDKDDIVPEWSKKLYKKIAFATHPDKTKQIKIDSLEEKLSKLYMLAVEAYQTKEHHNLLMIAADLDIEFDELLIEKHIKPAIKEYKRKLNTMSSNPGYLWYHVPAENKKSSLKDHLKSMGFIFTDDEVEKVIKKVREKNERKVGKRPVKSRRMRLK